MCDWSAARQVSMAQGQMGRFQARAAGKSLLLIAITILYDGGALDRLESQVAVLWKVFVHDPTNPICFTSSLSVSCW
jgi:hypothetical protein